MRLAPVQRSSVKYHRAFFIEDVDAKREARPPCRASYRYALPIANANTTAPPGNYEDASLGPMLQRHDAENSRPGPVPKSYHAMHGRRRIRAVRKRNEHFQLVKNYAREQADCSLPLTVPHPPSRQESPPTGWLQQLKRKAILWALHPPCFFRRPPIRAERILRHRAANRRRWIWLQKREKFFCRGLSFEVVPNSLSQSHDLGLVTQLLPWLGLLLFLNELGCASQSRRRVLDYVRK